MGHPDKLTPDVVEWLLADERVAARWKELARRLGLQAYVPGKRGRKRRRYTKNGNRSSE